MTELVEEEAPTKKVRAIRTSQEVVRRQQPGGVEEATTGRVTSTNKFEVLGQDMDIEEDSVVKETPLEVHQDQRGKNIILTRKEFPPVNHPTPDTGGRRGRSGSKGGNRYRERLEIKRVIKRHNPEIAVFIKTCTPNQGEAIKEAKSVWHKAFWDTSCSTIASTGIMVMWKGDREASTIYKDEKGRCLIIQFKEATTDSSWIKPKNIPFKLNITYLKDKEFVKNIHVWWKDLANYYREEASPSIKWVKILKDLKSCIKEWGNIRIAKLREEKEKVVKRRKESMSITLLESENGHMLLDQEKIETEEQALKVYTKVAGQELNKQKSTLMIIGIQNNLKSYIADFFQIPLISKDTFFNYLGVPISVRKMKVEDWMHFLERIRGKLSQWPHRFLNLIDRKLIFQSTIAQMPNFSASLILAPKSFLRALRSIAINFLWSPKVGKQPSYCPVGWDKVTAPLWKGDLRIRDPYLLADVRGAKRCWDFLQEGKRKWKEVLLRKYCFDFTREDMLRGTQPRRSGLDAWKLIAKHWEEVAGRNFPSLGHEGRKINFWSDRWVGPDHIPFSQRVEFWRLRELFVAMGHTKVANFFDFDNNKWKPISTMVADDNGFVDYQILRAINQLNEELSQVNLRIGDTILAKTEGLRYGSKTSVFESRSFYENIHERMNNPHMRPYPIRWHWIWWRQSQNKHNHIHWRLAHKAFICSEIMYKWRVVGLTVCQMCMEGQPNLNHLWWKCPKIRSLWHSILEIFSIEHEGWLLDNDSSLVHPFLINKSWEVQMQALFNKREANAEHNLGKILSQT
eukprot:Gb_16006 [translate_table: standard]